MFAAGRKAESSINVMVGNLHHAVFCLTFVSIRFGISAYVDIDTIYRPVSNILVCLMVLLCYRRLSYQGVVDELYIRMDTEAGGERKF